MNNSYFWNKKIIISYLLSILVFWIHCPSFAKYNGDSTMIFWSYLFSNTLNRVAVPLFFIMSGAIFFRDYSKKKYVEKVSNRVRTLVVPFFLWNILNMGVEFVVTSFFSQYFIGREKMEITISNILLGIFHYKYNRPFWFVFALIIFAFAAPIFDKLLYSKWLSILTIIALIVLYYNGLGLPQPLFFTKTCIIYYLVGGIIGRFYFELFTKPLPLKLQVISAMVIIGSIVYFQLLNYGVLAQGKIAAVIILVILCLCLWNSLDLFLSSKDTLMIPNYMTHSFWVFALHTNIGAIIAKLLYLILPKTPYYICLINFGATTVLTLFVIEKACNIIEKLFPKVYMLLSGGR